MTLTYKPYYQRWIRDDVRVVEKQLVIEPGQWALLTSDINNFELHVLLVLIYYLFNANIDVTLDEYWKYHQND